MECIASDTRLEKKLGDVIAASNLFCVACKENLDCRVNSKCIICMEGEKEIAILCSHQSRLQGSQRLSVGMPHVSSKQYPLEYVV